MKLKTVPRTRVSAAIVAQIDEAIRTGELAPGSPLPAERPLCEQLGVSRTSLREAIRILEHSGVLEVRGGSGTFVTAEALSRTTTMRAQAALAGEHSPLDLMVARKALEPVFAEEAARHRRAPDLDLLAKRLREHADVVNGSMEEVSEANLGFHLALVHATHNPVLVMLHEQLAKAMRDSNWHVMKLRRPEQRINVTEQYVAAHEAIYRAVERSDPEAARLAMLEHLDAATSALFGSGPVER